MTFFIVARCQYNPKTKVVEGPREAGDLEVGDDVQDFSSDSFNPAPGIEMICVFPKNTSKDKLICFCFVFVFFLNNHS